MKMNATELRKNLFTVLEKVCEGETAEILYKGSALHLKTARSSSKLARAKRRHALLCEPDAIAHSDIQLLGEMQTEWEHDWKNL